MCFYNVFNVMRTVIFAFSLSIDFSGSTTIVYIYLINHVYNPEYHFMVEARDNDGTGLLATVPLTVQVLDVNDEAPKFLRDPMDFILAEDGLSFTERAFIKVNTESIKDSLSTFA